MHEHDCLLILQREWRNNVADRGSKQCNLHAELIRQASERNSPASWCKRRHVGRTQSQQELLILQTLLTITELQVFKRQPKRHKDKERKQRADEGEESAKQVLWEWVEVMQVALEK